MMHVGDKVKVKIESVGSKFSHVKHVKQTDLLTDVYTVVETDYSNEYANGIDVFGVITWCTDNELTLVAQPDT